MFIAEGATTGTLTVSTEDDDADETADSITAVINAGAGYTVVAPPDNQAEVTVLDNDPPAASITAADRTTITEGTAAIFTVSLSSAASAGGLTVSVTVTESGSYIAGPAPATVNIASGATTGTLAVSTEDDSLDESAGSITARAQRGHRLHGDRCSGQCGDGHRQWTTMSCLLASAQTQRPLPRALLRPSRWSLDSAAPAGGLMVSVTVTERGSYIDGAAPRTVTIPIAEGATTGTLMVLTDDDDADESTGSITAELNAGAGYTVAARPDNQAEVTVLDDDPPVASISADPTTITEGEFATFRVTLSSAAPAGGLTINVDVTESGSYIAGSAPTTVVIAEGATTGTLMVATDR